MYILGTFCGWDKGMDGRHVGDNAWVRTAGHLRLVSRDQLRPAVGFENWAPDQDDLDQLRSAEQRTSAVATSRTSAALDLRLMSRRRRTSLAAPSKRCP